MGLIASNTDFGTMRDPLEQFWYAETILQFPAQMLRHPVKALRDAAGD